MLQAITMLTLAQADTAAAPAADQAQASGGAVEHAFNLVQALPIEAHAAMGLVLLMGLALWLFGGKLVKPLFALAGIALGGMVGLIVLPALGLQEVGGAPGSLIGMGIGAVIGLVLALVMLKISVILAAGLGFAAAGFLGGTIYLEFNPLPDDQPPAFVADDGATRNAQGQQLFRNPYTGESMTIQQLTKTLDEARSFLAGGKTEDEANGEPPSKRFEAVAVQSRAICAEAYEACKDHWNALSVRERLVVLGSTLGSMALGLLIGFAMPKRSTAAITALAGSAVWLAAAVWLIDAFMPSAAVLTNHTPEIWAVIWGVVFLFGLVVQLAGLGKPSAKKEKKKPEVEGEAESEEGEE
ncbi:MAG: hypothetical protein H6810_00510 [Phycisphaeraceae bacterium]|nr:MAG: hypothetical protein H6810_00510 [Phycisphaeraceae bacterium]